MRTKEIIQDEIIRLLFAKVSKGEALDVTELLEFHKLTKKLDSLKSAKDNPDRSTEPVNYFEIQEYTSDDYMKLEKSTIVELLMNCQKAIENASQFQSVQSKENTANKEGLLPCPFCGNYPEWVNKTNPDGHYYLRCYTCQFTISDDRRDKVFGQWNQRIIQPVQSVKGEGERTAEIKEILNKHIKIDYKGDWGYEECHSIPFITGIDDAVKALESYKHSESKEMYPKEFVEWFLKKENHQFGRIENIKELQFVNFTEGSARKYTLEDIFNHWSSNH